MGVPGYPDALRVLCQDAGADLHRVLTAACEPVPAWDPVDFAHRVLFPLAARWPRSRWRGRWRAGRLSLASR
jgi:hypothetical protein